MSAIAETTARILDATVCEDLFGTIEGSGDACRRALASKFRALAKVVHPDRCTREEEPRARAAFVRLTALRDEAERKIERGTYGDRTAPAPFALTAHGRTYEVGAVIEAAALGDVHACTFAAHAKTEPAWIEIARDPADADLLENATRVLRVLRPRSAPDAGFHRYVPELLDSFRVTTADGSTTRANVFAPIEGTTSWEEIVRAKPLGIDFRDAAWMVKRLLAALGFVHRAGFVHGAVVPAHVRIDPVTHGAKLVEYAFATPIGEKIRAIVPSQRALYAPEILARERATPASDLYMAGKCALALLDRDAPEPLRKFLSTLTTSSPRRRPDDAWALHEELDALLLKLVGKKTYRPFSIST